MIEWLDPGDDAVAEMEAVNQTVTEMLADERPPEEIGAEATREIRRRGEGWLGAIVTVESATTRSIETEQGPIEVRIIAPDDPSAVYLHLHGGGFVLGGADQQDALLDRIAERANVAVVSVEYRLAPEHPFPAGPDDCEAAASWLIDHAENEFGTDRLLIGGESAGAHLAALTLLRLRDRRGTVEPFAAANLVFGIYDLGQTPSTRRWDDRNPLLASSTMAWFNDCFTPGLSDEERRDPAISPLYADLGDLVPALFTVGTEDPLLDDSLFMGARWRAAGNPTEVVVFPGAPHGFIAFPTQLGREGLRRQVEFLTHHAHR